MKARPFLIATVSFGLGLASMWYVATQTHWLRWVQGRSDFRAVDSSTIPWKANSDQAVVQYFMRFLHGDEHTGEVEMLVRYPAGQINPLHTHPVGHGMYVLQGRLVTNRGTFGPGSYVWCPPDEPVSHGAGPDEEVVVLFTTHFGMTTRYLPAADR